MAGLPTIPAKSIVTRPSSGGWFGCDYNMNIYRGCCHGCIYCDSRSACYQNLDFDTVKAKENALEIIRRDLRGKKKPGVVATGSMSDPYNPFEKSHELTRGALKLLLEYGFGVAIATKSDLVMRDIDLLAGIRENAPVIVKITITTVDEGIAAKTEPNAPSPARRLEAIRALSDAGIYCGVLLMPTLPFICDSEEGVLAVVGEAARAGARFVYSGLGVTQRTGQREYMLERLEREFPGMGRRYEDAFGTNYQCSSPHAKKLWAAISRECFRLGMFYKMKDIISDYKGGSGQMSLF